MIASVLGALSGAVATPVLIYLVRRYATPAAAQRFRSSGRFLLAAAAAGTGAVLGLQVHGPGLAAAAVSLALMLAAAAVDVLERRLPDALTLPAAAVAIVGLAVVALSNDRSPIPSLAGAAIFGAALLGIGFLTGGVGLGDSKLALGVGAILAWQGWSTWFAGILAGLLILISVDLVTRVRERGPRARLDRSLPYGPAMLAGTVVALLLPTI